MDTKGEDVRDQEGQAPSSSWTGVKPGTHSLAYNAVHHFGTITHHKLLVGYFCCRCGLYWRGFMHDWSKYSFTEFHAGMLFYQGYQSPNGAEREARGYSAAWLHHKGHNKHHLEYLIDVKGHLDGSLVGMCMPTRFVVEMFCDRIAACRVYQGDAYTDRSPLEYYDRNVTKIVIHEDTARLLVYMLTMLAEKGEKETFRLVKKKIVKNQKKIDAVFRARAVEAFQKS